MRPVGVFLLAASLGVTAAEAAPTLTFADLNAPSLGAAGRSTRVGM